MKRTPQGDCVEAMKVAIRSAGLTQNPGVCFSTRPRFERKDLKDAKIFITPTAPDIERISREDVIEHPAFQVWLVRAIREADSISVCEDLDAHSMDAMFKTQSELIQVLAKVDGVVTIEPMAGPDNTFSDDGIWFTVFRVTFFGEG